MKELKCPKCGSVFQVDEADYASILSQVKNAEFDAEIHRRLAEIDERHKAEQDLAAVKTEQSFQTQLNKKDKELDAKESRHRNGPRRRRFPRRPGPRISDHRDRDPKGTRCGAFWQGRAGSASPRRRRPQ